MTNWMPELPQRAWIEILIYATTTFSVLCAWAVARLSRQLSGLRQQHIEDLKAMDLRRTAWVQEWTAKLGNEPSPVAQKPLSALKAITAAQIQARSDWEWFDGVDCVMKMEWFFEKNIKDLLLACPNHQKDFQLWSSFWSAQRERVNQTAFRYNAWFMHPLHRIIARLMGWKQAVEWTSEQAYNLQIQLIEDQLDKGLMDV